MATYNEIADKIHGVYHQLRITLDGVALSDKPDNVVFVNTVNDSTGLEVGTVYCSQLTFTIDNPSKDLKGEELYIEDGVRDTDGTFQYAPIGYFRVDTTSLDRGTVTYNCYDRMAYAFSGNYDTALTFPTTDKAIIEEICQKCKVPFTGKLTAHTITEKPTGIYKTVLGYMLQLQGKNAFFNSTGTLEIKWYEKTDYTIDDSRIYSDGDASTTGKFTFGFVKNTRTIKKNETKYETQTEYDDNGNETTKQVPYTEETSEEQTYSAGDGLQGVSFQNPFMTQEIVTELYNKLKGFEYTPATFQVVGDFRIRVMTIITATTNNGISYDIPVMNVQHSCDGGVVDLISSYGQSESSNELADTSGLSKSMARWDAEIAFLKTANVNNLTVERAKVTYADISTLNATNAAVKKLDADTVKTNELEADIAKLGYVTASTIEAQYARLDKANIPTAWIDTAMIGEGVVGTVQIADGSITDAKIVGMTANKITAGKIDAGEIEVVNLNAANITVGTINGKQIASGAIDTSKLDSELTDWISSTDTDVDKALKDAGLASSAAATATSTANAASSTASAAKTTADSALTVANASVTKIEVEYYKSTSATALSGGSWSTTQPTWTEGTYIWSRNKTTSKAGTVTYSTAACITGNTGATGATGAKGDTGATGKGVKSIVPQYYLSTSNTTQTGGSWSNAEPTWASGKYIWTRSYITWSDNTTSTTTPVLAAALNSANSTANSAVSIANGKTTAYYQTAQPSGGTYKTNDLWFDTDGGYQMYYYNGSKWVATQYGSAAILASAVTAEKIAASAVTSGKIAAGAVVADAIAANAVTAGKIATNAVTASTIAANAVTTDKIAANAITSVKIATDAVTADKIVAGAITSAKIAAEAITSDKILAGAVTADKISVSDLYTIKATIGGFTIDNRSIHIGTPDKIYFVEDFESMSADDMQSLTAGEIDTTFGAGAVYIGQNMIALAYNWFKSDGTFNIGKGAISFDGETISLGDSAQDKFTQICKDTVTTSYINALKVTAGSVAAENITGTNITGKNIIGSTIEGATIKGSSGIYLQTSDNVTVVINSAGIIIDTRKQTNPILGTSSTGELAILSSGIVFDSGSSIRYTTYSGESYTAIFGNGINKFGNTYGPEINQNCLTYTNVMGKMGCPAFTFNSDGSRGKLYCGTTVYGTSFVNSSSKRYKMNVEDMTEDRALKLLEMRPVSYDYIDPEKGMDQLGLIAEEVDALESYPVCYDEYNRPDGLDYSRFVPMLIKLCQIQQKQIDNLQTQIAKMAS